MHDLTLQHGLRFTLNNQIINYITTLHNTVLKPLMVFEFIADEGSGGALNFFQIGVCSAGLPKCGACELSFDSERRGLVELKFSNMGA